MLMSFMFYSDGKYDLDFKNNSETKDKSQIISTEALTDLYKEFIKEFPIVSIEDPFDQDHWDAWTALTNSTDIQVYWSFKLEVLLVVVH